MEFWFGNFFLGGGMFVFFLGILKLLVPNPKGIVDKMTLPAVVERYVLCWVGSGAVRGKRTC